MCLPYIELTSLRDQELMERGDGSLNLNRAEGLLKGAIGCSRRGSNNSNGTVDALGKRSISFHCNLEAPPSSLPGHSSQVAAAPR